MNELSFDKGWLPLKMLDHWIKSKYPVIIYASTGAKVSGIIKGYDNYNMTIISSNENKIIVSKGNIFYIERIKEC